MTDFDEIRLFLILFILFCIGLGPCLLLLRGEKNRVAYALAVAPALALAIIDIFGFPLFRYAGPVERWAFPATIALILMSAILLIVDIRSSRGDYAHILRLTNAGWVGILLLTILVLSAPILFLGIDYRAFRSNPSDAFLYMSLAETTRVADWPIVQAAIRLTHDNLPNLTRLAEQSPTALLTARFFARPMQVNHMTTLAWAAELVGTPIYRFYYGFHVLQFAVTAPLLLVLGRLLGLPKGFTLLAMLTAVLGFWSRYVLEMDAGFELSTIPLLALLVIAWSRMEDGDRGSQWHKAFFLAIPVTAILVVYLPALSIFGIGCMMLGLLHLWRDRDFLAWLRSYALAALLVIAILLLSGQLLYHVRAALGIPLDEQKLFTPTVIRIMQGNGLAGLFGLPVNVLTPFLPRLVRLALLAALNLLGLGLIAALGFGMIRALAAPRQSPHRVLAAVLLAGGFMFVFLMIASNPRSAGKAFTFVAPYLMFGILLGLGETARYLPTKLFRGMQATVGVWLVMQLAIGASLPFDDNAGDIFLQARENKTYSYDLSPVLSYLSKNPPQMLIVNVPREKDWIYPFYVMMAMQPYPAHYQAGLVIDNDISYQNLWLSTLDKAPDYVLVLNSVDDMAAQNAGQLAAKTSSVKLYHTAISDPALFRAREEQMKQREANKKVFPTLLTPDS